MFFDSRRTIASWISLAPAHTNNSLQLVQILETVYSKLRFRDAPSIAVIGSKSEEPTYFPYDQAVNAINHDNNINGFTIEYYPFLFHYSSSINDYRNSTPFAFFSGIDTDYIYSEMSKGEKTFDIITTGVLEGTIDLIEKFNAPYAWVSNMGDGPLFTNYERQRKRNAPQTAKGVECFIRGIFWGNAFGQSLCDRLGGQLAVLRDAPVAIARPLNKGVWLQCTSSPLELPSTEQQHELELFCQDLLDW